MGLTKREIDAASYDPDGPSQQVLYDDQLPGFGLRIYPSGAKSFILRYRTEEGRQRLFTLGRYGVLTLQQARKRARKRLVEVHDGGDPLRERRKRTQGTTVEEFADTYLERHAKPHKKTWKEDERRLEKHVKPSWGARKLSSIRRSDVARLHNRIGEDAPYEANRVLALVSVLFSKAEAWGVLPEGTPNPASNVEKFTEKSRDRYLKPHELERLAKAVATQESVFVQAALWLLLLEGVRKSELLSLRWEDVDLQSREMRLVDTKAGRDHTVPLSEPAARILHELPRFAENPHVFPGRKKGEHLTSLRKAWNDVREKSGLEDVRMHDLRRTVGSWMVQQGESLQLVGEVLNHRDAETTKTYARLAKDQSREALEKHGERVLDVVGENALGFDENSAVEFEGE